MTHSDPSLTAHLYEYEVNAAHAAHANNARIWAHAPDVVGDDDPNVVALVDLAWRLFFEGDIDYVCRNDLLEIVYR